MNRKPLQDLYTNHKQAVTLQYSDYLLTTSFISVNLDFRYSFKCTRTMDGSNIFVPLTLYYIKMDMNLKKIQR